MQNKHPPTVLICAGNDPSGGAGLCADIQALASIGCHSAPVVTCITVQNTHNVLQNLPLTGTQVIAQAEAILTDIPIAACKLGLLGSVDIIEALHHMLVHYPHIPVILDPILAAGGGQHLATIKVQEAMINALLPLSYLITPNSQEAYTLTGASTLEDAAVQLMNWGCQHVCITGTHENTTTVINTLYTPYQPPFSWHWPRLPGAYHGSGCTLAASVAGLLAQGKDIVTALYAAQHYTWTSLQQGYQPGEGQLLPNRLFRYLDKQ